MAPPKLGLEIDASAVEGDFRRSILDAENRPPTCQVFIMALSAGGDRVGSTVAFTPRSRSRLARHVVATR
jgi:hypothetical protein